MNSFNAQIHPEDLVDPSRICFSCALSQTGQIPTDEDCMDCTIGGTYADPEWDKIDENDVYPYLTDEESDQFRNDVEADANALVSAGFGTDEDYGCYYDECHIDDW